MLKSGKSDGTEEGEKNRTQYKVIRSLLELWTMIIDFSELVRCFPCLIEQACSKLLELIKIFNKITRDEILLSGAFDSKKLKSITAKHLCKYSIYLINLSIALTSNCISFLLDQVPFIQSNLSI